MEHNKILRLVFTGLLTALVCVATMVIKIPVPATGGYLNLGDAFVLISGWLLGPAYGFFAAGVGSCLTDLLAGYFSYVPGTFLIKGCMGLVAALLMFKGKGGKAMRIVSALAAEVIMVLGYFLYENFVLGYGMGAAASVLPNMLQGAAGFVIGLCLYALLEKTGLQEKLK